MYPGQGSATSQVTHRTARSPPPRAAPAPPPPSPVRKAPPPEVSIAFSAPPGNSHGLPNLLSGKHRKSRTSLVHRTGSLAVLAKQNPVGEQYGFRIPEGHRRVESQRKRNESSQPPPFGRDESDSYAVLLPGGRVPEVGSRKGLVWSGEGVGSGLEVWRKWLGSEETGRRRFPFCSGAGCLPSFDRRGKRSGARSR